MIPMKLNSFIVWENKTEVWLIVWLVILTLLFVFFLWFRLAQEREEAKAKKGISTTGNTSLLEKMKTVDFHVKAVPGTEVPGHKVCHPW